jgi:hypothetical protein
VRAWRLPPLQMIKIAASFVALGSSVICVRWVFQRRQIEDVNVLLARSGRKPAIASMTIGPVVDAAMQATTLTT